MLLPTLGLPTIGDAWRRCVAGLPQLGRIFEIDADCRIHVVFRSVEAAK